MTDAAGSEPQRSYVVLGCHRAGTSAITSVLQILGLYLGEPDRLIGPIADDNDGGSTSTGR